MHAALLRTVADPGQSITHEAGGTLKSDPAEQLSLGMKMLSAQPGAYLEHPSSMVVDTSLTLDADGVCYWAFAGMPAASSKLCCSQSTAAAGLQGGFCRQT